MTEKVHVVTDLPQEDSTKKKIAKIAALSTVAVVVGLAIVNKVKSHGQEETTETPKA